MRFSLRLLFLVSWGLTLNLAGAEEKNSPPAFGFALLPSIQYAHTDIYFHTPPGRPPAFTVAQEIVRGQRLDLLVLVQGYKVDEQSRAHVTYDFVIHYPNGKTQPSANSVVVADLMKVTPPVPIFPKKVVSFVVSPEDPAGEYRIEVTARDHLAGTTATKSTKVTVSATDEPLPLPADLDLIRLLTDYYMHPRPRLVLPALLAFSKTPVAKRPAEQQGALLGFYERVLADNEWLLPQFKARIAATKDDNERRILALVLAFAQRESPKFGDDLKGAAKNALESARKEPMPLPNMEPRNSGPLDVWWGNFLASGRFEPVINVVTVAQTFLPNRGKIEEFKKLPVRPKSPPPEVVKDAVLGAAMTSLSSNAFQHRLVRDYLASIYQMPATTPAMKAEIKTALEWKPPGNSMPQVQPPK